MKIKMRKQSCGGTDEDTYDVQKEEFNFLKKPCENEAKDANKKGFAFTSLFQSSKFCFFTLLGRFLLIWWQVLTKII